VLSITAKIPKFSMASSKVIRDFRSTMVSLSEGNFLDQVFKLFLKKLNNFAELLFATSA
jgi:hypothetical protein